PTGTANVDVTGTYTNIDPATITISGASVVTHPASDTTGSFSAPNVAIAPAATTTITATGRNRANIAATSSVDVTNVAGGPAIIINTPADNTTYASTAPKPADVAGTINASAGAIVQVNGVTATVDASNNF